MNTVKLVKMANEIAAFFDGEPDRQQAIAGFVDHLCKFWDPRMRRELVEHVGADPSGAALCGLASEAIASCRARLLPA